MPDNKRSARIPRRASASATETPYQAAGASGPTGPTAPVASGNAGGTVRFVTSERKMKPYTIFETEISALSRASALSSLCFSVSAGLLGYALKSAAEEKSAFTIVVGVVLAAFAGGFGIWANSWKNEIIEIIRKETGEESGPAGLRMPWSRGWTTKKD